MIDRRRVREDGFTEAEIDKVEAYCSMMARRGEFSNQAEMVVTPAGGIVLVCRTVARGIERVRPGAWLRRDY